LHNSGAGLTIDAAGSPRLCGWLATVRGSAVSAIGGLDELLYYRCWWRWGGALGDADTLAAVRARTARRALNCMVAR
jgi:hypothetical protein